MASSPAPHTRSVRTNRELESIRTKWYMFDKRDPLLAARVAGLNLQGKTQKTLFFTKEIKTTVFILEFTVIGAKYSWQVQRTFDELREFYTTLMTDPLLMRGKELLKVSLSVCVCVCVIDNLSLSPSAYLSVSLIDGIPWWQRRRI